MMYARAGLCALGLGVIRIRRYQHQKQQQQHERQGDGGNQAPPSHVAADGAIRVLFYVQHLRGVGHLRRASVIARGLVAADEAVHVTVVMGGPRVPALVEELRGHPRVTLAYLPQVFAADTQVWQLVDETGRRIDDAWMARRRDRLLQVYDDLEPDVVMIEMFPFGRRRFHFELEPLLDRCYDDSQSEGAHRRRGGRRPVILSSVRDVLVKPGKGAHAWAADKIWTYFDKVLVHGDPAVIPFGDTFQNAAEIGEWLAYTGFVVTDAVATRARAAQASGSCGVPARGVHAPPVSCGVSAAASSNRSGGPVLVSAGGGESGDLMLHLRAAVGVRAHPLCPPALRAVPWHVYVGWCVNDAAFQACVAEFAAPPHVHVQRATPDFPALLLRCSLSISQGGYNTTLEVLAAGCPAVIIPVCAGADNEQAVRAEAIARIAGGRICVTKASCLSSGPAAAESAAADGGGGAAAAKAAAAAAAASAFAYGESAPANLTDKYMVNMDGAAGTAEWVLGLARGRRRSAAVAGVGNPAAAAPPLPIASLAPCLSTQGARPRLTVCITHYKRHANVLRLLDCLSRQTIRPEIFLWNNSGKAFSDPRIAWQLDSSHNRYCWPRWFMLSLARSEFVTTIDDDLIFSDDRVLEDAVRELEASDDPFRAVGFAGCVLHPDEDKTYKDAFHLSATKFPWNYAHRLPWQSGIAYSDSKHNYEASAEAGLAPAAAAEASSSNKDLGREPEYWKKGWLHTPRWLSGKELQDVSGLHKTTKDGAGGTACTDGVGAAGGGATATAATGQGRVAEALRVDIVKGRLVMTRASALHQVSRPSATQGCVLIDFYDDQSARIPVSSPPR